MQRWLLADLVRKRRSATAGCIVSEVEDCRAAAANPRHLLVKLSRLALVISR
jgi:hypothetical protein